MAKDSETEGTGDSPNVVFNVGKVRRLVELMNTHDLAEIDLKQGDQRIRLRRGPEPAQMTFTPAAAPMPAAAPAAAPAPAAPA
ncbi:MAG: acetyl-CoA carboxylase, biotin carboxyl carrier protein, partial [Planctomycetota bacterium]